MANFHDNEYDGLVLKLPSWFIELNGLEGMIADITEKLNACNRSIYHPDHTMNLYELENYKEKKQVVADIKKRALEYTDKKKARYQRFLNNEIFEISEYKYYDACDIEWLKINFSDGSEKQFKVYNEVFSQKDNITSEFKKFLKKNMKNIDWAATFRNNYASQCSMHYSKIPKENIRNITITMQWTLRFNMYVESVKIVCKKSKRSDIYYTQESTPFIHPTDIYYTQESTPFIHPINKKIYINHYGSFYFIKRVSDYYELIEKKDLPENFIYNGSEFELTK